ncbi:MAG: phenylalanine--tRNA ligase subunit beta [Myxococcota bacterium]|jgi:phenylalanyl-tRNA synthetase beta chain|nr:phenylalanine--tRNA ligase subunit beta [Myxococcota bacterium]
MLISMRWLERHVDLSGIDPETLANDLTLSTAEVEGIEPFAPHLSRVVVGHVVEREAHPDADKLSACKVDVGSGELLSIVCGAPNVAAGQKVAAATVGTVLPGDFKIKKSKIRGVASFGMICSVRELELGDEHDGIWVLPDEAPVGKPVAEALGLQDWVIEIDNKSLTHRPDLWGHRGIANEVAAIYRRELKPLDLSWPALGNGEPCGLSVESEACSRYLGLAIDNARPLPSPDWLKYLLLAVDQRPIDQIVDLSNFVMLDLGQPNHTFDASQLAEGGIVVRDARAGETITTLDGEERELEPSDLLICSGDEPVALAGIMGGEASKVGDDTSRLLLEVATFQPTVIRRTSSRLGLRTDSSSRFEKTLDPNLPEKAARHFARLLQELQPDVQFPAPLADAGDWSDPALTIRLRPDRVRTALGKDIPNDEFEDILVRLGFGVTREGDGFNVAVPSGRATKDITIEQDLIEEIGRIYRYGNIPERPLVAEITPPIRDERRLMVRAIQDRLSGGGRLHEVMSYSFVPDSMVARLGEDELPHVRIVNPIDQAEARMRRSILPSLLVILENNRRQRDEVRLFEIGKGYHPEHANERGEPREVHRVALAIAAPPPGKKSAFDDHAFAKLQGVIVDLIDRLGLEPATFAPAETTPAWAHPARALEASLEGAAGSTIVLANLEPGMARELGLSGDLASDVAVAEVSIDHLLEAKPRGSNYRAIPRFPAVKVDVAVDLPLQTHAAELVAVIEKAGKGQVVRSELFDVYTGDNVDAGRKSLAYHVHLQSETKTLSDKDQARFLKRFEQGLDAIDGRLRK